MIKILKYTEYLYLIVAVLSAYKIVSLWGQSETNTIMFAFFAVVSLGMFFFRRNYRLKFEKRKQEKEN